MFSVLKHLFKLQFFIILISILAGIYYPQILETVQKYVQDSWSSNIEISVEKEILQQEVNEPVHLFTKDELLKFDGSDDSTDIYLSILGSVYDVTKGKKHYGSGCAYNMFAGKDASASFITGNFETYDENSDDVVQLKLSDLWSLFHWKKFYDKEYTYIGKLIGRFYDEKGQKTSYHHKVDEMLVLAEKEKEELTKQKEIYPPCNIQWSQEKGTRVWCTSSSGGTERGWTGVPRKYFEADKSSYRCACIKEEDINSPQFKEYDNCNSKATECFYTIED